MKKCKLVQNIRNFKFCYFIFCTIICLVVFHVSTSSRENSDHVVRVGSFEETYNIVNEKGEIDILGGISYTDEGAQNMLFSDMPMGEEKYYIYKK